MVDSAVALCRAICRTTLAIVVVLSHHMFESLTNPSGRLLKPMDRISEILLGLIMALTFTCSLSCNLAWGIIDAVFYLMAHFSAQGRGILRLEAVRTIADPAVAHRVIADALPPLLASVLSPADFEVMRQKLKGLPAPPARPWLHREQWLGASRLLFRGVSTLPVVLPFVFVDDPRLALRTSNLIAVVLLFVVGYRFGYYAGHHPLRMGFAMVALAGVMVGITAFSSASPTKRWTSQPTS